MTGSHLVVVTGGARGIGAAISALRRRRSERSLPPTWSRPQRAIPGSTPSASMFSAADDVAELSSRVVATFGRVDVLVNSCGIWFRRSFTVISVDEWDRVIAVNLRGLFVRTQAVLEAM